MAPRGAPTLAFLAVAILAAAASGCSGCGCGGKKQEDPVAVAPPPGAASSDELSIGLGQARGLNDSLAPTSTKWRRTLVINDKSAMIIGDVASEAIALVTSDAGKTWRSIRAERDTWANWGAAPDGTVVLAAGSRDGAASATAGTVQAARVLFATLDAPTLTAPSPLFPDPRGPAKGTVQNDAALPAVLSADLTALLGDEGPRKTSIFFGGKPGADAAPKTSLPSAEKFIAVPFGRPPVLASTRGKDLLVRPFPQPAKPLDKPQKVAGVFATKTLGAELSVQPACESNEWSFALVKQPPAKLAIVALSAAKTAAFVLPEPTAPATRVGCGGGRVVVEGSDEQNAPLLITCDLTGKCVAPQNTAFRPWPGEGTREIAAAPAEQGIVGVMSARAGDRWGLYLAQSGDGAVWERQRVIGEGTGDRGRVELGAVLSLGKRLVLLLSAGVTGTSRRGWFVIISDDGGVNWNPP
jgi:hypothetical protein